MQADSTTWSSTIQDLIKDERISVIPYTLHLDYDYWDYHDIISSILPLEAHDEIPSGFSIVGHVAHLNLREQYLPYKHIIAQVLLDKNPVVKTVINKIDNVGEENEYRTFQYEVLTGPDDLNVEVSEEGCDFHFNYAKVYWNPRLQAEHRRLVEMFKEGEAVCDVMAGVGPFAVPAGKKKVFVWANDLNPDSYVSLEDAIARNKVGDFVQSFNTDGHAFIREAAKQLWNSPQRTVSILGKRPSRSSTPNGAPPAALVIKTLTQPHTFSHYVMNLPASALSFLPSFIGLYTHASIPQGTPLPELHVYCFSTKSDDNVEQAHLISEEISRQLAYEMRPGDRETEGGVKIWDVRDVAPNKRMFCASFVLPKSVAWRDGDG